MSTACGREAEWEAKVAAGIGAALDFAAADPAAVHALTIDARRHAQEAGDRAEEVVRYFAEMLGNVAPAERLFPISTDEGTVESIAMVIRGQLSPGPRMSFRISLRSSPTWPSCPIRGWPKPVAGPNPWFRVRQQRGRETYRLTRLKQAWKT